MSNACRDLFVQQEDYAIYGCQFPREKARGILHSYLSCRKLKSSLLSKISSPFSFSARKTCHTKQRNNVLHRKPEVQTWNPLVTQMHPRYTWPENHTFPI